MKEFYSLVATSYNPHRFTIERLYINKINNYIDTIKKLGSLICTR